MDFAQARKNMVDCQISPMGVQDPLVLARFENVPRENFVPANLKNNACIDEDLPLGDGSFMAEPSVLARMMQAAAFERTDSVLVIGDHTGYAAAVISGLVANVVCDEAGDAARMRWEDLGCGNISTINNIQGGHAPFNVVFICGAVPFVPPAIIDQLSLTGRAVAIVRQPQDHIGRAVLIERAGVDGFSTRILFDAGTPYLPAFKPAKNFSF